MRKMLGASATAVIILGAALSGSAWAGASASAPSKYGHSAGHVVYVASYHRVHKLRSSKPDGLSEFSSSTKTTVPRR